MSQKWQRVAIFLAAAIGAAGGIYFGVAKLGPQAAAGAIEAVYATSLPDLDLHPQALSQWKNQTLVINFWASWCIPCRDEIPALVRTQARYSPKIVQIVGIALDNPDQARAFAKAFGINYPVLIGSVETMDLTRSLGNRSGALPYTLVLPAGGGNSGFHLGALDEAEIDALIAKARPATPK